MNQLTKKTALVTGITGQDGTYLAELLLDRGYKVIGLGRKDSIASNRWLGGLTDRITYVYGEIQDNHIIRDILQKFQPCEIYNLASQSLPGASWGLSVETAMTNGIGAHQLYECVRVTCPTAKVYQASSSEMFGNVSSSPQTEKTKFAPVNPYAASKLYAHNMAKIYRESYGVFISCGILFNHESPRRGINFITQKVAYGAACAKLGILDSDALNEQSSPIVNGGKLALGNLDAARDWGYAPDYVEAMYLMLQQEQPDDFVIGTGKSRTIRQLCEAAYGYVNLEWSEYVYSDPKFFRP